MMAKSGLAMTVIYIGTGDGGSAGDPSDNAQNISTLLGKILRIDVDYGLPYTIPLDNPFVDNPQALDEVWAIGVRNPWRFSFDRQTGDMFIADVGQSTWEEVNFQPLSSVVDENYGWRLMEGNHYYNPPENCNDGLLNPPILEYEHSSGNCSITGGFRYRGIQNPNLSNIYFYDDFCSGRIWGAIRDEKGIWRTLNCLILITVFLHSERMKLVNYILLIMLQSMVRSTRYLKPINTYPTCHYCYLNK